jgi:autotransporter passenger strand-loop-strand repeat protein
MFAAKYEPAASRGDKSMTVITVPPNQNGFVIHPGDRLEVNTGGVATNTTVQGEAVLDIRGGVTNGTTVHWGGEENVYDSGVANGTTLHRVGVQFVYSGGVSNDTMVTGGYQRIESGGLSNHTTVFNEGLEFVANGGTANDTAVDRGGGEFIATGGVANHTVVNAGGAERVEGLANDTTIEARGRELVFDEGQAHNVTFAGSHATLELENPSGLTGVLADWQVGDVVDLLHTHVHSVDETGGVLTVTYGAGHTVTYMLADQQAGAHVAFRSDGHGGTDLILTTGADALISEHFPTHFVGVHNHESIHFGPGPHFFFL